MIFGNNITIWTYLTLLEGSKNSSAHGEVAALFISNSCSSVNVSTFCFCSVTENSEPFILIDIGN
jgi:hypothetical protein